RWKSRSNGTSLVGGDATGCVSDRELSSPSTLSETGTTDQYQPEPGSLKRKSPRFGVPTRLPFSSTPTELIRLNRCAESRLSKPRSLAWRKSAEMIVAMTNMAATAQIVEKAMTRKASERGRILDSRIGFTGAAGRASPSRLRLAYPVTHAAHRLDHVDAHLLAQATDEHLDRIGIAVEILVVQMLDQFRARHHLAHVVHEVGEQPEFVRGQLQGRAVDGGLGGLGVEPQRPAGELR